jgi:hypothetical protein
MNRLEAMEAFAVVAVLQDWMLPPRATVGGVSNWTPLHRSVTSAAVARAIAQV